MSYFRSLRESIGSYISLSPHVAEPRVVSSAALLDLDSHLSTPTPSLTRRTREWVKSNDTGRSDKKSNALGVKGSRITKSSSTQRPATRLGSSMSRGKILGMLSSFIYNKDNSEIEDGLEGNTIIENAPTDRSPVFEGDTTLIEDAPTDRSAVFEGDTTLIEDAPTDRSSVFEGDTTLIEDNYSIDRAHETTPSDEIQTKGYAEDELWLHQKLVRRGEEPLFHNAWGLDFPTFPEDLFTLDQSKILIHSIHQNDFHGSFL